MTHMEIEVRFASETEFLTFIQVLNAKYTDLSWSKYLQRDCTQVVSPSGRNTQHTTGNQLIRPLNYNCNESILFKSSAPELIELSLFLDSVKPEIVQNM